MSINATWHKSHRMPKNPTPQQRLTWHTAHAKHCDCRELTPAMKVKLETAVRAKK